MDLDESEIYHKKAKKQWTNKKNRAPGENGTHDSLGSRSYALSTVFPQGHQKYNDNYTQYDNYTHQLHSNHVIVI